VDYRTVRVRSNECSSVTDPAVAVPVTTNVLVTGGLPGLPPPPPPPHDITPGIMAIATINPNSLYLDLLRRGIKKIAPISPKANPDKRRAVSFFAAGTVRCAEAAVVVTATVSGTVLPLGVEEPGVTVQVDNAGAPVHARLTRFANPAVGTSETAYVAVAPAETV